jgi:hypothetical protein
MTRYNTTPRVECPSAPGCRFWVMSEGIPFIQNVGMVKCYYFAMTTIKGLLLCYGPQEAVGYLDNPAVTAVLVIRDNYQLWENPGFSIWKQVTFMDMPCNTRERLICRIGALFGWNAKRLERWADNRLVQIWRENAFPFRPFLPEHARFIDAWMRKCLDAPGIKVISIHCVYGKNRSRAVWAALSGLEEQGNADVYRGLIALTQAKSNTSSTLPE